MRPLRPDNESKNRPPSGHLKQVRVLTVTPSTSPLDSPQPDGAGIRNNAELPPPLPEKSSQADYANIATDYPDSSVYDVQCLMRRGTHKDRGGVYSWSLSSSSSSVVLLESKRGRKLTS